jgi:hypothetical protein
MPFMQIYFIPVVRDGSGISSEIQEPNHGE